MWYAAFYFNFFFHINFCTILSDDFNRLMSKAILLQNRGFSLFRSWRAWTLEPINRCMFSHYVDNLYFNVWSLYSIALGLFLNLVFPIHFDGQRYNFASLVFIFWFFFPFFFLLTVKLVCFFSFRICLVVVVIYSLFYLLTRVLNIIFIASPETCKINHKTSITLNMQNIWSSAMFN